MSHTPPSALRLLEEPSLRALFTRTLGWKRGDGEHVPMEVDGREHRVTRFAAKHGTAALLCEAPPGVPLPDYAARREIRRQIGGTYPDHLTVFTDALHSAQVWTWVRRKVGWHPTYREYSHTPSHPCELLLTVLWGITRELDEAGEVDGVLEGCNDRARSGASRRAGGDPEAAILNALLAAVRKQSPAALCRDEADLGGSAQALIEGATKPETLRAFWRALTRLTILDPACGTGKHLVTALEVLEPLYDACLERMRSWVDDLDRSRTRHRPEKLADFRRTLARADDPRYPTRQHSIRELILLNNLYGVDRRGLSISTSTSETVPPMRRWRVRWRPQAPRPPHGALPRRRKRSTGPPG
jgi:hypothetical protein